MKILVIMKRFGANKDMVMQNFGRQVRLFESLSKHGHNIDFLCPDYKKYENKDIKKGKINYYIRPYSIINHFNFAKELKILIKRHKYDIIVGTTDPLIGIFGYFYSKKFNIKYIYDIQDEYSDYDTYKLPFVKYFDRIAMKNSDIVLTVSDSLNQHVKKIRKKPTYTIQNGIDLRYFKKIDKNKARKILNLPKGKIIIFIGALTKFKGVDILIEAFKEIKNTIPDAYLLLSGAIYKDININHDSVIYRKYPKREEVITALNAADVAVIPNRKDTFSEYCFPYKLLEYMSVNVPIVATAVGDVAKILKPFKGSLCEPNSVKDLKAKIFIQLKKKNINYRKIATNYTWEKLSKKLDKIIKLLK